MNAATLVGAFKLAAPLPLLLSAKDHARVIIIPIIGRFSSFTVCGVTRAQLYQDRSIE